MGIGTQIVWDGLYVNNARQSQYKYYSGLSRYIPNLPEGMDVWYWKSRSKEFSPRFPAIHHYLPRLRTGASRLAPLGLGRPLNSIAEIGTRAWLNSKLTLHSGSSTVIHHMFFLGLPASPRFRSLVVALDLIPEKFSTQFAEPLSTKQFLLRKNALERADRIIAISENTRQDLIEWMGISPLKISTVHLGVDADFFSDTNKVVGCSPSESGGQKPYFLQVGGRLRHKNFPGLLRAFVASGLGKDFDLVSAGEPWDRDERILITELNAAGFTKVVTYPSEAKLRDLYKGAHAFVYPSLYEGFGMPILEAMASGCPILVSDVGPHREVAGDCARYFDPDYEESFICALREQAQEQSSPSLCYRAQERAKQFSWQQTAEKTFQIYRALA